MIKSSYRRRLQWGRQWGNIVGFGRPGQETNFLLCCPERCHQEWEECEGGLIRLVFHHDGVVNRVARWLSGQPEVSYMELDELGSHLWRILDGDRTVQHIVSAMVVESGDSPESMQRRCILFLRVLSGKRLIRFLNN